MLLTPAEDRGKKKKKIKTQQYKMVFPHNWKHDQTCQELPMGKKSLRGTGEVLGDQRGLSHGQGGGKDGRRCSAGLVRDTRQKHRAAPTRLLQKAKNKQEKVQNNTVGLQRGTPRL